jgi:hypothetical protein
MKLNETLENEIATRLNLIKPICPPDVAAYVADGEAFREALDRYERPSFSWRATTDEARATIAQARKNLDKLEELADKADSHSETVILATKAFWADSQQYNETLQAELYKPRKRFETARDEFVAAMEKEKRSLKRKQNKGDWTSEEYRATSARLELVEYMIDQARYMNYNPETSPDFTEAALWEQIAQAEYRASSFLAYVTKTVTETATV